MKNKLNKNIFGETIEVCSKETMTGYLRNGSCETLDDDIGNFTSQPNDFPIQFFCIVLTLLGH